MGHNKSYDNMQEALARRNPGAQHILRALDALEALSGQLDIP
jgi:hypothetical protein